LANYRANSIYADEAAGQYRKQTTPVGQFLPNSFGLYDMHGNVLEWCEDDWHHNYEDAPKDGRAWLEENATDTYKLLRGGCWYGFPRNCHSAYRHYFARDYRSYVSGFRVCCVLPRTLLST
jgi:formylglycine-generating enzyme required for sulfatase activity